MPQPFVSPPVPPELPDWIVARKPPNADTATLTPPASAVFFGLDAELDAHSRADTDELVWPAETAEQTTQLMSRDQVKAILEGNVKLAPPGARWRQGRKSAARAVLA